MNFRYFKIFGFKIFVRKSSVPVIISIIPTSVIFPENKNSISSLNKNPTSPAGTMAIKILITYDLLVLFSLSNNP